jgi:hypothetical protein
VITLAASYLYLQVKVWGCRAMSEWASPVSELKMTSHFLK